MNPIGREQVARLYDLAKQKSDDSRRTLVENISDLFLTPEGRLNEHQRMLMTDILFKLVSELETVVRRELADVLVVQDSVPAELLNLLANDQIEIARPILEQSGLLRDQDLIEIIKVRSDDHRLCIAIRARLSEEVSDALIREGSADVVEALLKNQDAAISEHAMAYLVAESQRIDRFQEPLLSRHDLPQSLAQRMFWWVSAALRRKILTDFSNLDLADMDTALQTATRQAMDAHRGAGVARRADELVCRLAEQGELTPRFLTQCLKQQKLPIFVAGLAHLSGIGVRTAWRIFSDREGESFAVLCKAIAVNRNDFASLFLFLSEARGGQRVRPTIFLKESLELYDAISAANARAALTYWQREDDYQQALNELIDAN